MPEVVHIVAGAGRAPYMTPPLRLRIRPWPREVRRARHWFRGCLRGWPEEGAEAAEFVFGEIAANAVRHGRSPVTITVELTRGLVRCEIRDGSWRLPRARPARSLECEGGRGMVIVAALADDWGVRRHLAGKTIWFEVRTPA